MEMTNSTPYLSISQAAEELNMSTTSIYKLIDHKDSNKRLEPINRNTYRGEGGFKFRKEDVERVKQTYTKKGFTPADAANRIGRSITFIKKLMREGHLPYEETEFRGKVTHFIKEADFTSYIQRNPDAGKQETIYDKKTGYYLFQRFTKDGDTGRIMEMKRVSSRKVEICLQTTAGRFITIEKAIEDGWKPEHIILNRKPITTYGNTSFSFPQPQTMDSFIYRIIETFFELIGPANMKIDKGEILRVEVKKSVLTGITSKTHPELIDKLKLFLQSGELIEKYDGVLIDTGLSPLTFYLSESKKKSLQNRVAKEGKTIQEWLESQIMID